MSDLFQSEPAAVFSPCRRYRFELWRRWAPGPYINFIGLNPSTADENTDDPTIRRCIGYAKYWGYNAICMTNLFAFRATDPADMLAEFLPVGDDNDVTLARIAKGAAMTVAAWGVPGSHMDRGRDVARLIPNLKCLGRNRDGSPKHPLYLRADMMPEPFITSTPEPRYFAPPEKITAANLWDELAGDDHEDYR